MLIVDPPAAWVGCDDALTGRRELDLQTDHALMCFPRILAFDRLRGRYETFANGGAVAGVLARMDDQRSPWQPGPDDELLLRPGTRAARVLTDAERSRLAAHGINALQSLRTAGEQRLSLRTLAGGTGRSADSSLLTSRRRALLVMSSIERGTRWAVFDAADRNVWYKLARQVQDFLQPLADSGLFGPGDAADACYVVCDERVNTAHDMSEGRVNLLVGLRSGRVGEYFSFMVSHSAAGSRVRPARANRLPPGTRMTVNVRADDSDVDVAVDETQRQRTLAQALFGYYTEPRPAPSVALASLPAETATSGRRDLDLVARFDRDLDGGGQRF